MNQQYTLAGASFVRAGFRGPFHSVFVGHPQVRHPPQSGWLDEWGRLKGGRPLYPTPGSYEFLRLFDKTEKMLCIFPRCAAFLTG